jgi:hypothetical protein
VYVLTLLFQRVGRRLQLGHVYDTVDVEGDLLAVCAPVLVAEAVCVFPITFGLEGIVAGGNGFRVVFVIVAGVLDLRLLCK